MRVLVCGGRHYSNHALLRRTLSDMNDTAQITTIIEGGANGADRMSRLWAKAYDIRVETFDADWSRLGAYAGPERNSRMISDGKPDVVVAFPGGRGTADMIRKAKAAGLEVIEVADG